MCKITKLSFSGKEYSRRVILVFDEIRINNIVYKFDKQ